MKNIGTVISYTFQEAVKKKSYKVTTVIMILIVLVACNISNIIKMFESDAVLKKVIVIDKESVLGDISFLNDIQTSGVEAEAEYEFVLNNEISEEEIKKGISEEEFYSILVVTKNNDAPEFEYIVKELNMFNEAEVGNFVSILKSVQINTELTNLGASEDTILNINTPISYTIKEIEGNSGNQNFLVALASTFILFFAVYFYGYSVSASVSSEKTSRVMETLITSTNPSAIIIGKTIAMGLTGLLQMVILIVTAVIGYRVFVPEGFNAIAEMVSGININLGSIIMVIIYFILGYTVYAFLNAVTGATVSKAEDVQSASAPISFISIGSFYLAYFSATIPNGGASKFASMFPFSAAFSMPGRILAGGVATWEIILSIVILILTAVILAFVSIKVYSAAILHYGDRLKLKDLVQMFKSKD